jgi:hypothetical protein
LRDSNLPPEEDGDDVVKITEQHKDLFEIAVNLISNQISSPIAKVIGYMQVIRSIIPNFDFIEAEDIQDSLLKLILYLKDSRTIESLFIDLKML